MNRLQSEVHRLYMLPAPGGTGTGAGAGAEPGSSGLIDAAGRVRAMVLALARPADWVALSRVWHGVQRDLSLPAPAIAVSGTDAYQLWFSLLEPVAASQAQAFLAFLRERYLGDIQPARVGLMPALDASAPQHVLHAEPVPAQLAGTGVWSAFVASDLAPLFAEEPWLDMPPNPDGQAVLLARLQCIQPADFARALEQLKPAPVSLSAWPALPATAPEAVPAASGEWPAGRWAQQGTWQDPQQFLLDVMNDGAVALVLRIDAAKALLQHAGSRQGG